MIENEEIELFPAGIITIILNDKEIRALKISPKKLTLRLSEEIYDINELKVSFYNFNLNKYEEVILKEYKIIKTIKNDFYYTYVLSIDDSGYCNNVRNAFRDYTKYVMNKAFGEDNEFSKEMVDYPYELDYDFYEYYSEMKKDILKKLNYKDFDNKILNDVELAISIDNDVLYEKYLCSDIKSFKEEYLKDNYVENHVLFKKDISRIYIGNEFCHNLFPKTNILFKMLEKAQEESISITICFTYIRECYIDKTKEIINSIYDWCIKNNKIIEIVINDYGMIKLLEDKKEYFSLNFGVLLNKRKKDPRYIYKKGYEENKELISQNSLNSTVFKDFLRGNNITRFEYENCGYKIDIAKKNSSIHIPFYCTNTSQYCPLYAMCTTMDRGNQILVDNCPKYCTEYIFAYPKHLKMIGRYNSLFAFDDTLLEDWMELKYYIDNGVDRIVLNFI